MSEQDLSTIAAKVAKNEKTPELSQYWQTRYEKILQNDLFVESEKTVDLILNDEIVENPATPFGDIYLLNHLDANGKLDDVKLQSTVETAVRFLDSALDAINFSKEAQYVVKQYRKIGIGLADIAELLEKTGDTSELKTIDHLGNLISNSAYRASETLAQEKSPCSNWNQINRHLRPRSFEIWVDPKTGERFSGLALSEEHDEETILETELNIIPRRNSNILLFPPDLEWQIWSDRDNLAPETKITEYQNPAPEVDLKGIPETIESFEELKNEDEKKEVEIAQAEPMKEVEEIAPAEDPVLEIIDEKNQETPFNSIQETQIEDSVPVLESVERTGQDDLESQFESREGEDKDFIHSTTYGDSSLKMMNSLQIGELVKIAKESDPGYGKVYQIVDIINGKDNPDRYQLAGGNPEIEKVLWSENDLELVDLDVLLTEYNSKNIEPSEDVIPAQIEIIKAESQRQKNLELTLYKEELKQEMQEKYSAKNSDGDAEKIKKLQDELTEVKKELELVEKSEKENKSDPNKITLTVDELETKISERIDEYLESAEYKNKLNQMVQQKVSVARPKSNPEISSSISTLKMLKKYQNLK